MMSEEAPTIPPVPERPAFEIQDPVTFFSEFFAKDLTKSQFETQADYDARLNALQSKNGKVFLEVQADLIQYTYKAETKTLLVVLRSNDFNPYRFPVDGRGANFCPTIALTTAKLGTTPMQNAFGVTVNVSQESHNEYILNVLNFREMPMKMEDPSDVYYDTGLAIAVPGPEAESIVRAKSVTLILGVVVEDLHGARRTSSGLTPTIDLPISSNTDVYMLPAHVTDMMVYNKDTGYILGSWSEQQSTVSHN